MEYILGGVLIVASSEPFVFQSSGLEHALELSSRIYLSGHLSLPQESLPHMSTTSFEMGVSHYREFTHDTPHLHAENVEFNYVAEGETHLCDISSGKIWRLSRGSVFIVGPNTPYATKHRQGTKVVFFKAPGGNDKRLVELSPEIEEWLLEEI